MGEHIHRSAIQIGETIVAVAVPCECGTVFQAHIRCRIGHLIHRSGLSIRDLIQQDLIGFIIKIGGADGDGVLALGQSLEHDFRTATVLPLDLIPQRQFRADFQ